VVLWELAMDAGGVNEVALTVEAEEESWVGVEVKLKPLNSDVAELTEAAVLKGGPIPPSSETIFIPTEVPVLAGINKVVTPFFLMTVRGG
jgi:hypothetical protein